MDPLRAVKGMNDLFENDLVTWRHVESAAREVFLAYGFGEIRTPLVEDAQLFIRGVGEGTDIVGKEMFLFPERGPEGGRGHKDGESDARMLCLRPENTAGVVRAMIENGKIVADTFHKVFYVGAQFRNERPQAGRTRQFHQLGCEVLGYSEPTADVEVMALVHTLMRNLGITDVRLHLNSLGDAEDRARYVDALVAHLRVHESALSDDSRRRLTQNPLRILDSKDKNDQKLVEEAPKPIDFLGEAARAHFDAVRRGLDALRVEYVVDNKLVRGLDYYSRTVFELVALSGLGAQSTLCAGGRYDGLVGTLGGRPTPAFGFAGGIERLVMVLAANKLEQPAVSPTVMLIGVDDAGRAAASTLAFGLRARGVRCEVDLRGRSVKALMRHADRSGARCTLVLGEREINAGTAELKEMGTGTVAPVAVTVEALAAALRGA